MAFQKGNIIGKANWFRKGIQSGDGFQKGNSIGKKTWFQKGHKVSEVIRKKISDNVKGHKAWNWKGGRIKTSQGYILIWKPKHPNVIKKRYVSEHRLIMEKKLGRYLTKKEVVHHENDIRDDNRIKNLRLFKNQNEHKRWHENKKKPIYKRIINFILNTFKQKWKHIVTAIKT